TRLPLGSTSSTVTVIVPVKALSEPVSPLPSKTLLELPATPSFGIRLEVGDLKGSRPMLASTDALRSTELFELLRADVFSWIWIVRMSPTRRARRSSNRPRKLDG